MIWVAEIYNSGAAIPLIVTEVPLDEVTGRGAAETVCGVPEDRPVPNTLISIPGAKDWANDAPFPTDATLTLLMLTVMVRLSVTVAQIGRAHV